MKRSQAVSLRLMASLSCSGEARDTGSKRVRRALLRMGALHNVSEPEQAEEDLPGGQQGKNEMSLEYFLCHKARQCSKNTRSMSRRHRSQCRGAPTGQIKVILMPSNCFPKAGWLLSVFGQREAESGLTVKVSGQGLLPYSLLKTASSSGGALLCCYSTVLVPAVPLLLSGHELWALISLYPPLASPPHVW